MENRGQPAHLLDTTGQQELPLVQFEPLTLPIPDSGGGGAMPATIMGGKG